SASSVGSTPSTSSIRPPTPIGSPSSQAATSHLLAATVPDAHQANRKSLPPQFPLEAARMLKQMMADRSDGGSGKPETHTPSRCPTPHGAASDDHYRIAPQSTTGSELCDSGRAHSFTVGLAGVDHCPRSRTSSLAASQLSATEGSDGAEQVQSVGTVRTAVDGHTGSDSLRAAGPWARTNPERMSTWSSSSARTLADGLVSSRVSSADDPFRASKPPLSSAALATLTASAAMINRQARGNSGADGGRKIPAIHGGSTRIAGGRPVVDLGLSIRTDLEQRVRSYSESGRNPLLLQEGRPHSSMGFHDTVAGAPVWGVRPGSTHRHPSPLSASLRQFRADKFNPNRRSVMSIQSRPSKQGSLSADILTGDAPDGGPQSGPANIGTSYSSNAPERLLRPTAAATADAAPLDSPAPGPPAAGGKRRSQTMDPQG
ncbi:hypothetical protein LPJ61_005401, partial [Coemansia biformis]